MEARAIAVAAVPAEAPTVLLEGWRTTREESQWKPVLAIIGLCLLVSTLVFALIQA
jgi:hypothetical protein